MYTNSDLSHRGGCLFGAARGGVITFRRLFWSAVEIVIGFILMCVIMAYGESKGSGIYNFIGFAVFVAALAYVGHHFWVWWIKPLVRGGKNLAKSTGLVKDKTFKDKPFAMSWKTAQGRYINIGNPFRGIFVMGGAGSGKSESVAVPAMQQFANMGFAGIVYDFKFPTLAKDLESFYSAVKSPVRRCFLDLDNPTTSYRVNPLSPKYVLNSSYANEFAQAIVDNLVSSQSEKGDFWTTSATSLLTACIWYLRKNKPEWSDLPHVCAMVTSPDEALLKVLHTDPETANMTISVFNAMKRGADAQVAGVVSTLQNAIARINTPQLMWVFGSDDVSLDINDPKNPTVLTVGSNPTLVKTYAPLCSLTISVAIKMMNQQGKHPSFVLLDEAPTIKIPNFSMLPATGRSNKIVTMYMCQDFSQMVSQYGQNAADEIFSNLNNHFYGRVSSGKTAAMLSKQFGRVDESYVTTSASNTALIQENYSESLRERDMMRSNEFTSLQVGEFAGLAVETDTPVWRAQLAQAKRPQPVPLPTPPQSGDINAYYTQVRKDIDNLLGTGEPTAAPKPKPEEAGKKDQGKEEAEFIFE